MVRKLVLERVQATVLKASKWFTAFVDCTVCCGAEKPHASIVCPGARAECKAEFSWQRCCRPREPWAPPAPPCACMYQQAQSILRTVHSPTLLSTRIAHLLWMWWSLLPCSTVFSDWALGSNTAYFYILSFHMPATHSCIIRQSPRFWIHLV